MLNLPRCFLRLPVIIDVLPYNIVNGTLANADEVMSNFNYIVDQVNANAQQAGGVTTEWIATTDTPTYVSVTSFTLPGDYSAVIPVGRACKMTITAGTAYGFPSTVTYNAGTNLTTLNFPQLLDTNLDSGLSAVFYGILNSENRSTPVETVVTASLATSDQVMVGPAVTPIVFNDVTVYPGDTIDTLTEFDTTTGEWTALRSGHYRFEGQITANSSAQPAILYLLVVINGAIATATLYRVLHLVNDTYSVAVNAKVLAGDVVTICVTAPAVTITVVSASGLYSRFMVTRLNGI